MAKRKRTNVQPFHRQFAETLLRKRAEVIANPDHVAGTEDEESTASLLSKLTQKMLDASIIENQRTSGKEAPHRSRKATAKKLRAAVDAMHQRDLNSHKGQATRTFSDVCGDVAQRFGYERSAKQVKEAADDIKWPDPRRRRH